MNDKSIEKEIKEKKLTAPRITPEHIESVIFSEHYFTAREGGLGAYKMNGDVYVGDMPTKFSDTALSCLTFCVLVLRNGFTVVGESACASPENFDPELGRKIARDNAKNKIWMLEGYSLKQKLHDEK
jgi:hypothetical protein